MSGGSQARFPWNSLAETTPDPDDDRVVFPDPIQVWFHLQNVWSTELGSFINGSLILFMVIFLLGEG